MNIIRRVFWGILVVVLCSDLHAQTTNVWKVRRTGVRQDLFDVAFGRGVFVAVGQNATILTSPNGRQWTVRFFQTNSATDYTGVAFGNGTFVAVGPGNHKIRISTDGINWGPALRGTFPLYGVTFGEGRFVAVGDAILTSVNGRDWKRVRRTGSPTAVAHGNGRFVAVGEEDVVWTSRNGVRWTNHVADFSGVLSAITFNGSTFIAAERDLETDRMWTSNGGVNWSPSAPASFIVNDLAQARDTVVVAVGENPTEPPGRIHVSPDGLSWPGEPTPARAPLYGVAYGRGNLVAVGQSGLIMQAALDDINLSP